MFTIARISIVIFLTCFYSVLYSSQETVNFFAFSKNSIELSIDTLLKSELNSKEGITFTTTIEEYDSFLEPMVAQILKERSINYLGKMPINNKIHIRFQIEKFMILYSLLKQESDSLYEIGICYGRMLSYNNGVVQNSSKVNSSFGKNVTRSEAIKSQKLLPITFKTEIPDSPSTILEEILTPVLFIGTAVVTLLLLFTVRTQ